MLVVVFFVLIPPLVHLWFFFPPRGHISHFVCLWVSLRTFPFKRPFSVSCGDVFCPQSCLVHVRIWFHGVDDSLFFLICCCSVVWVRTSKFSLVPGFFGWVILSVRSLLILVLLHLWCLLLLWFVCFRFSSSSWEFFFTVLLSCCFFYLISWLLVYPSCFSVIFWWEFCWGSFGHWHGRGQHILGLFS